MVRSGYLLGRSSGHRWPDISCKGGDKTPDFQLGVKCGSNGDNAGSKGVGGEDGGSGGGGDDGGCSWLKGLDSSDSICGSSGCGNVSDVVGGGLTVATEPSPRESVRDVDGFCRSLSPYCLSESFDCAEARGSATG